MDTDHNNDCTDWECCAKEEADGTTATMTDGDDGAVDAVDPTVRTRCHLRC